MQNNLVTYGEFSGKLKSGFLVCRHISFCRLLHTKITKKCKPEYPFHNCLINDCMFIYSLNIGMLFNKCRLYGDLIQHEVCTDLTGSLKSDTLKEMVF